MDNFDRSLARIAIFALLCLAWAFSLVPKANAQADWLSPQGMTQVMPGVDDGTYHVSLGHPFPYYGGVFTDAWMSSNGVIILYDPVKQFGNPNTYNSFCCSGMDFSAQTNNNAFSFLLAPLWTDLVDTDGSGPNGYYYKTNEGISSFLWYNVAEFYDPSKLNTFQANLWPDGSFDFLYDDVNITNHQVTIGFSGNTTYGDYGQMVHQYGFTNQNLLAGNWWDQLVNPGGVIWYGQDGGYESSLDCSNALNDPQCPGYAEAYFAQQCSFDSLYSQNCPGYAAAYFAQQCDLDPFYDTTCPGYDQAVLLQDMAGTDFIFGDDITDFYNTNPIDEFEMLVTYEDTSMDMFEEEDYGYTETTGAEDTGGYEEVATEAFENGGDIFSEELSEFYTESEATSGEELYAESFDEPTEEGMEGELVSEDPAIEDEYIEEEITDIDEEISNIEEDLLIDEELATVEGPSINAVGIALSTAASAEANAVQIAEQAQSNISVTVSQETLANVSEITQNSSSDNTTTFSDVDSIVEDLTFDMLVDPTITISDISIAVDNTTDATSQEEEQTLEVQLESSTPQQDTGFAAQQDQSFSTGQSISAVLNNVAPNFSQFDVAPPSQQEQRQTAKAEAAANNMTQEQLAEKMESMSEDMQDSGGFGDQSLTIFLMGRVNGFDNYGGTLSYNQKFYVDRGMPGGSVQNDRNTMLQLIGTSGKHEEMVAEQYK